MCSSQLENIVQLNSAAVIIFEHSFYVFDKAHYLQDEQKGDPSFYFAVEQYIASSHAAAVREAVSAAVQTHQEVKQSFKCSEEKEKESYSRVKTQLIHAVLEITLNNRLYLNAT
ncbi:uncharacterized protein EDB93DRAFT_1251325 [Suillus bovinus]|uniref:uncharacterized protein n=1 Tax=Suillus bovinus TaxID=48563 RepID=UPI001B87E6C2|nr:uncharacterized protein EDB93DRAFT_1251325 [Suillus bovinus]KAG2145455.1 hypothetical protein EDB93DRAFT_1251325 [Suillus bovinus]